MAEAGGAARCRVLLGGVSCQAVAAELGAGGPWPVPVLERPVDPSAGRR